jgi:DNA-binding CsgD family transcriptional regulator
MLLQGNPPAALHASAGSLMRWGLSADADLVYRALVAVGPQLRGELSRTLGITPRRVSAALDELRSVHAAKAVPRTLSSRRSEEAPLWAAGSLAAVTDGLLRRHYSPDPWERVRRHAALTLRVGLPAWPSGALDQPRILAGPDQVQRRIAELADAERNEHLAMNPEPAFDSATVRIASPLDRALRARGVALRTLGVPTADGDATAEHERQMARLGVQHRIADALPLKLMIFDHQTALVPIDPLNPARGALEVDDTDIVRALVTVFREQWASARRPAVLGHLDLELAPRESALIELLATGHTDTTAAARLHISSRTVRYVLRDLMDRFGAENRFQLGLALGTRGVRPTGRASNTRIGQETT